MKNNKKIFSKKCQNEENIIPESFEIESKDFFTIIKEQNIKNGKLLNDLKVYSKVISMILTLPMKIVNKEYYISIKDVQQICEEEFKNLSKNWKE